MPELRLSIPADTYEAIQKAAALNQLSLSDVATILLQGGIEEQKRGPRDN